MEKVRLGIIGIGGMGTNHALSIVKGNIPEMELTAVADIREIRRSWASVATTPFFKALTMAIRISDTVVIRC